MEFVTANLAAAKPQRRTWNGRDWWVAPFTSIVPGVLEGSQGPLLYTPEETARNHAAWDDVLIVADHPTDNDGRPVSAAADGVRERSGLGLVRASRFNGKLGGEVWLDAEDAPRKLQANYGLQGQQAWRDFLDGKPVEISTGLFTDNDEQPGKFGNRPYVAVARNHRPDHLAILVGKRGACSVADGCGLNVNQKRSLWQKLSETLFGADLTDLGQLSVANEEAVTWRVRCPECDDGDACDKCKAKQADNAFGKHGNPQSGNTGKFKKLNDGFGKGDAHEAAQRGAMVLRADDWERGADARAQAEAGSNPPSWVADEETWERAKTAADKGGYPDDSRWAVTAHIYDRMGGQMVENAFCPTGEGGGVDPSCSPGGSGGGGGIDEALGSGKVTEDDFARWNTGASKARDKNYKVGAKVSVDKNYGGGRGYVVGFDRDGSFAMVKIKGDVQSFHNSNLKPVNNEETDMPMTKEQRGEAVKLLANCDCWKGKDKVLANFDDDLLASLKAQAEREAANLAVVNAVRERFPDAKDLIVNAMPEFIKEKIGDDAEAETKCPECGGDMKDGKCAKCGYTANAERPAKTKEKPVSNATTDDRRLTEEEFWARAPASAREERELVKRVLNREKAKLVQRLTANVRDEGQRKAKAAKLMARALPELEELAELIPAANAEPDGRQPHEYASLLGNAYPPAGFPFAHVENAEGAEEHFLETEEREALAANAEHRKALGALLRGERRPGRTAVAAAQD